MLFKSWSNDLHIDFTLKIKKNIPHKIFLPICNCAHEYVGNIVQISDVPRWMVKYNIHGRLNFRYIVESKKSEKNIVSIE